MTCRGLRLSTLEPDDPDLERTGRAPAGALAAVLGPVRVPAVVIAELEVGVAMAKSARARDVRRASLDTLLGKSEVVPFTAELAPTYAAIYLELRRRGTPNPQNDLAVAATALHHDDELLVGQNDEAHFRLVPGLRVRALRPGFPRSRE